MAGAFWILLNRRPITRRHSGTDGLTDRACFAGRGPCPATMEEAMAGHSQFKNIMHRKGRQDKVRSKLFGKLAREITVSAKLGIPDPAMNPRLRAAVLAARAENMTKDTIERAVKK